MKKQDIAICGAMLLLCGCGPELAQVNCGAEEADWARSISQSYPGYKAPRMAPPAIADNVSPRLVKEEEDRKVQLQEDVLAAEAKDASVAEEQVSMDAAAVEPAVQEIPQEQKPAAEEESHKSLEQPAAGGDAKEKPVVDAAPTQTGEFEVYEVRPGDTLGSIAKKFYGSARQYDVIMRANKIEDPKLIRIGTKLSIPKL